MKYCDNANCENEATTEVKASIDKAHDATRNYCSCCFDVYLVGVQHGRYHEAAIHGTKPGPKSSQLKPGKKIADSPELYRLLVETVGILAMSANNEEETPHDDDLARTCSPAEPAGCLICECRHAIEMADQTTRGTP